MGKKAEIKGNIKKTIEPFDHERKDIEKKFKNGKMTKELYDHHMSSVNMQEEEAMQSQIFHLLESGYSPLDMIEALEELSKELGREFGIPLNDEEKLNIPIQ